MTILQILARAPGYTANSHIFSDVLPAFGQAASRTVVRLDLDWLADQALITIKRPSDDLWVTTTRRRHGLDVAAGLEITPGGVRPDPDV